MKITSPIDSEVEKTLGSVYQDVLGESNLRMKRIATLVLRPAMTWATIRYIMRLPVVFVDVPKSERSRAQWMFVSSKPWRLRGFTSSYIELPTPLQLYWQGTSKQNLRTRTSRAKESGLKVAPVEPSKISDVLSQVFRDRGWDERDVEAARRGLPKSLNDVVCVAVFDSSNRAIGFCIGTLVGNVVRTLWSCTSQRGTARWLCFSGYVEESYARGARFIVESPPWAFTGGNQIFAGHLGFTPARVRSL